MASLSPYLFFNGNCREAMKFYKESLGGELTLLKVGDFPSDGSMPKDAIMHSLLRNANISIMASDMMGTGKAVKGNISKLCLVCNGKEEIESLFAKLSKGGRITAQLKQEFFGIYGELTDRFGIDWMLQFDNRKK